MAMKCTCCPVRVATGALCKACFAELEALKQKSRGTIKVQRVQWC